MSKPGKIKVLKDEIAELGKQLAEKRQARTKLEQGFALLDKIAEELLEKETSYSIKKELFDKYEDKINKKTELDELRKQYDVLEQQNQRHQKLLCLCAAVSRVLEILLV